MKYIQSKLRDLKKYLIILLLFSSVSFAEPLNVRTNNAGNITYSKTNQWIGQVGRYKKFVVFDSKENGLRAMKIVVKSNIRKNKSVDSFVERYTDESLKNKHIKKYANAIKKLLGRSYLKESDAELIVPLIVRLEGGTRAFNYYFGEKNVRTKNNGRFDYFVQNKVIKLGVYGRTIKQVKCYSLRDVLFPT